MEGVKKGCLAVWNGVNFKDNDEAKGYIKLSAARGPFTIFSALYATVALNELAKRTADCDGNILNGSLKATSAISSTVFIEGVITAVLSPFWGTIADNTPHRKVMYGLSHTAWILMVLAQVLILLDFDPAVENLFIYIGAAILSSIFLELSIVLLTAYLPEIATDEQEIADLTGRAFGYNNFMQLSLALVVGGIGIAFGLDDLENSEFVLGMVGGGVTIAFWLYWSIPGYLLIGHRKEKGKTDDEPAKCGSLMKLGSTCKAIFSTYPQIGIFLFSYMFFFSGVNNMVGLATSFLIDSVGVSPTQVTIASGLLLIMAIVGSLVLGPITKHLDLKTSYQAMLVYWVVLSASGPWVMTGSVTGQEPDENADPICGNKTRDITTPDDGVVPVVMLYGCLYGFGIGLSFALATSLFSVLIPGGEEGAYYGLKTVFSKLFTWCPALVYTAINEANDDSEDLAFTMIAPFFVAGLVVSLFLDFDKAKQDVAHTLDKRHDASNGATTDIKVSDDI